MSVVSTHCESKKTHVIGYSYFPVTSILSDHHINWVVCHCDYLV